MSLAGAGAASTVTTTSGTYRAGPPTTTLLVQPEVAAGNVNSCSDLGGFAHEFDVLDGGWFAGTETTVTVGDAFVRVFDNDGYSLSWTSNLDIDLVVVKASDAYDTFAYGAGARADTGLHGPQRYIDVQDRWQEVHISHALFCSNGTVDPVVALPPSVVNDVIGTYDASYAWDVEKSASATEPIRQPAGTSVDVDYDVTYTRSGPAFQNGSAAGTATVTNPNDEQITLSGITATLSDGTTCTVVSPPSALPPGTTEVVFNCAIADLPPAAGLGHTVTVTWPDQTLLVGGFLPAGSTSFEGEVPITENEIDECATVADSNTGTTVGGTICDTSAFDYSRTISVEAGCFDHDNIADFTTSDSGTVGSSSAKVTVCGSQDLVVSKTAVPAFTRSYAWTIQKRPDVDSQSTSGLADVTWFIDLVRDAGTDSAFAVTGDITVYNPNDFDLGGVTVTDEATGGRCEVVDATNITIPAASQVDLAYSCAFDSDPGPGINVAVASWDASAYATANGSASGTADFEFGEPTTEVNSTVSVSDTNGRTWTFGGSGTVSYATTYEDPAGTCTSHANTATIDETGQASEAVTEVCVGADIEISKTAATSYSRTYSWTISKSAYPTLVKRIGGTATFDYTVAGTQTGHTDSDWAVGGTISLHNPNDWQDIDVGLSESLAGCTLSSTNVTVPADTTVDVAYSCPLASATDGINTATATWAADTHDTPAGTASASTHYEFDVPTRTANQAMTFSDSFAGLLTTLGTVTATDTGPLAAATYTYSRTVNVPTWDCVTFDNTARIVETGQTAGATVKVCGAARSGALTMGYWQNKNGQAIISGYCGGTSGTSLASFLTGYNPFANMTATTCRGIATYVLDIIKAANASGSTMHAMLKAQMLATALDVYFSAPSLGGNRIGAPSPVGSVAIDLTGVCRNIGGSCTILQNTSPAFGGSPTLTVSQLLAIAADQSNTGGTVWYGNLKAAQELAKNTFDAVNNQRVFSA